MVEGTAQVSQGVVTVLPTESISAPFKLGTPSPDGSVVLPCGHIDEKGNLLDRVSLREMKGHEEDILASKRIGGPEKITAILGNCITRIGNIAEPPIIRQLAAKLTITDRVYLMLTLRILSLGANYDFDVTCPKCGTPSSHKVRLDDLDVRPPENKKVHEYPLTLPSGKAVILRIMTAEDEVKLERGGMDRDSLSLAIIARLKTLNGQSPSIAEVKDLGLRDRCYIRDHYERIEGNVDTDIDAHCPSCRFDFKTSIDVGQPSFFFPRTPGTQVTRR